MLFIGLMYKNKVAIKRYLIKKLKGNVEPLQRKYTYKKIDDQKLIQYVETHPDHFLHTGVIGGERVSCSDRLR